WMAKRGIWKTWVGLFVVTLALFNAALAMTWHGWDESGRKECLQYGEAWPNCIDAPERAAYGFLFISWVVGDLLLVGIPAGNLLGRHIDRRWPLLDQAPPPLPPPPQSA